MKHLKSTLLFLITTISITSYAQTAEKRNNISIGGGSEGYNGDLGSVWFDMDEELYGFVGIHYNRYLTQSFDLTSSLSFGDYGHCRWAGQDQFRPDGSEVLDMLGRLTCLVFSAKYKFANGHIINENAKIAPYLYLGAGINNLSEYWRKTKQGPIPVILAQ
jgi:hypothetical protein